MKRVFIFFLLLFFAEKMFANDTTSVNVYFELNKYTLLKEAKDILNDVQPDDSTITLKKIFIYGYSDSSENDTFNQLSEKRAQEVKKYLLSKNIPDSLIVDVKGKGSANKLFEQNLTTNHQQNRKVWIIIEYEAKVVEQTIIIKSNKKTQNN